MHYFGVCFLGKLVVLSMSLLYNPAGTVVESIFLPILQVILKDVFTNFFNYTKKWANKMPQGSRKDLVCVQSTEVHLEKFT